MKIPKQLRIRKPFDIIVAWFAFLALAIIIFYVFLGNLWEPEPYYGPLRDVRLIILKYIDEATHEIKVHEGGELWIKVCMKDGKELFGRARFLDTISFGKGLNDLVCQKSRYKYEKGNYSIVFCTNDGRNNEVLVGPNGTHKIPIVLDNTIQTMLGFETKYKKFVQEVPK